MSQEKNTRQWKWKCTQSRITTRPSTVRTCQFILCASLVRGGRVSFRSAEKQDERTTACWWPSTSCTWLHLLKIPLRLRLAVSRKTSPAPESAFGKRRKHPTSNKSPQIRPSARPHFILVILSNNLDNTGLPGLPGTSISRIRLRRN